jgi:hypothetical protein
MQFIYDDGGRKEAGFKGRTGDCVTRAIAIASQLSYQEVYDAINDFVKANERMSKRKRSKSSARTGVHKATTRRFIERELGGIWVPLMQIGSGAQVRLGDGQLPTDKRLVLNLSRHRTALINGIIRDTFDPRRYDDPFNPSRPTRTVYGYHIIP